MKVTAVRRGQVRVRSVTSLAGRFSSLVSDVGC